MKYESNTIKNGRLRPRLIDLGSQDEVLADIDRRLNDLIKGRCVLRKELQQMKEMIQKFLIYKNGRYERLF